MKKSTLLFLFLFSAFCSIHAQVIRCGTVAHQQNLENQFPWIKTNREKAEKNSLKMNLTNSANRNSNTVITIPVVVHVVWKTNAQNIAESVIQAQISQLNADYARLNSDTGNTPSVFKSLAANTTIQFCLAQQDPNGIATTGILRRQTTKNSFIDDDKVKYTSQGGDDAWPMNKYLNIWVCNLGGGLLGYAQFPGGPAATDGVVFLYSSLGSIASPAIGGGTYNLGRTATHEIGHWLNLIHIDGDSNCGDDLVSDTPTQDQLHYGCFTHPYHANVCSGQSPNGEMFMDYMDYTDDACMNMFSIGQKNRMLTTLATSRISLSSSPGCQAPSTLANDAGISSITSPNGIICASTVTPVVELHNYGVSVLNSVTLNYQIDNGSISTYNWTGTGLSQGGVIAVTLPAISLTNGTHSITVFTSNPNASADSNAVNDAAVSTFNFVNGVVLPISDGIENTPFPPIDWSISNPDNSTTWTRTTLAHKSGNASMYLDNANYSSGNGQIDEVVMQPLDLTTVINPHLSFEVAYTYWTLPYQYSDTLEVLVSADCGNTWNSVYKKWGNNLATAPGQGSDFIPTAAQWRLETIDLNNYSTSSNLKIKFRNISDYENNLYVDDINVFGALGVNEVKPKITLTINPNPSNGIFNLYLKQNHSEASKLKIYNTLGVEVYTMVLDKKQENFNLDLSRLPAGIYEMKVWCETEKYSKKIIIQ